MLKVAREFECGQIIRTALRTKTEFLRQQISQSNIQIREMSANNVCFDNLYLRDKKVLSVNLPSFISGVGISQCIKAGGTMTLS